MVQAFAQEQEAWICRFKSTGSIAGRLTDSTRLYLLVCVQLSDEAASLLQEQMQSFVEFCKPRSQPLKVSNPMATPVTRISPLKTSFTCLQDLLVIIVL